MLDFSNASILSYNHVSEFFGENNIRYKAVKNLTVEGELLSLRNLSGISSVWNQISGFEISGQNWHNVIINGTNFGSGVINNINFAEGNDVQRKRYNVDLQIYETGSSGNFPSGSFYSGINWNPFCEVESLSEDISFDQDFEKGEYNHSINVRVLSSNITGSINSAKAIAQNLFTATNLTGFSGQYQNLGNLKSYYSESYDLFTAECSFNKRVEILANITGNYSIAKTYSFNRDEGGVVNVSEKGSIKALQQPYSPILYSAAANEMASAFTNCSGVFNFYQEVNNYNLSTQPLVQGTDINTLEGVLNYEVIFTNNLNESGNFFWNYAHDFSVDEKGLIISSEKGEIVGRGNISPTGKYVLAVNGYDIIGPQISGRAKNLYSNFNSISNNSLINSNQFVLIGKNETFSDYLGKVNYSWDWSNDTTLSSGAFVKTDTTVSNEYRVPLSNAILVPGFMEVEQTRGNYTVGHRRANINLRGVRSTTFAQYLAQAKAIAATYDSVDNVESVSYSYNPNRNQFNFDISWLQYS